MPFSLLCLYVFFMFTAQDTLLPTWIHSVVMYGMVGIVFFTKKIKITKFTIWYIVFFLFSLLSAAFCTQSDSSILFPILVSLIISFCFIQIIDNVNKLELCLKVYVISAVVMALMIWQTGQLDYLYMDSLGEERLGTEITGNANIFTALFMYSGVFAAWLTVNEKDPKNRLFYLLSFVFILFIMISSGGRKTIIAMIAALVVFLVMKDGYRNKILKNVLIAVVVVFGLFAAILNIPLLYDLIGTRFEGLFDLFMGRGSDVSSDNIREQMIVVAIQGWLEQPLFGHGIDSFKFLNRDITGHFYYAHNNFVELLYDVGFVGFILFYYIYAYIYRQLRQIQSVECRKYKVLGYGLLVELLLFDMGGVSYYLVGNMIVLSMTYICFSLSKR